MKILLHAATSGEIQPFLSDLQALYTEELTGVHSISGHEIEIFISGVGIPATIYGLTHKLLTRSYDLCISVGICGSFNRDIPLGSVLLVEKDRFGDLGYEDRYSQFLDVFECGLVKDEFPYAHSGWLIPESVFPSSFAKVSGVTVNKVSGTEESARKISEKYGAVVETMEGAAVFLVCMTHHIPCLQLKSVSNYVEARDKSKWDIPLAIHNLNMALQSLLGELNETL